MTPLFLIFLYGLFLGSFYNVVGIRTVEGKSIVHPRSHCSNCGRTLPPLELIPLLSYAMQRGKCRGCHSSVSIKYPIFELITATLFMISPMVVGWSLELFIALLLVSLVVIVTISDLHAMMIPNRVLLFFFIVIVLVRFFYPTEPWWDMLAGLLVGAVLLLLIAIISRGGMGGGDVKLFAVLGLFVGLQGIVLTFLLSTLIGTIFGLLLMVFKKVRRKEPMPFAPYIGLAVLIAYFWGESIWIWYIRFFG
jgi:leader peptidase (prepilin peptidase)/N-methyltransferase